MDTIVLQVNALQRHIKYGSEIKIIDDQFWVDYIYPKLYPFWDSENDRLTAFSLYENGYCYIERKKYVKNFQTNEFVWKTYEWTEVTKEDIDNFVETIKSCLFAYIDFKQEDIKEEIYRRYGKNTAVSWVGIKCIRNFLLSESDWPFIEDSDCSTEDKQLWKLYRTKLRNIPQEQQDLLPNQVLFPIDPLSYKNEFLLKNEGVEYLSTIEQFVTIDKAYYSQIQQLVVDYISARHLVRLNKFNPMPVFDQLTSDAPEDALDQMIQAVEDGIYIG